MLLLMRRVGETIVIGGNIKITVTRVNGNQVHIGIDAPRSVSVNREEIQQRIDACAWPDVHSRGCVCKLEQNRK